MALRSPGFNQAGTFGLRTAARQPRTRNSKLLEMFLPRAISDLHDLRLTHIDAHQCGRIEGRKAIENETVAFLRTKKLGFAKFSASS